MPIAVAPARHLLPALARGLLAALLCVVAAIAPVLMSPTSQAHAAAGQDHLNPGESLANDATIYSPQRQYRLVMQRDGNAVLYNNAGQALWASGTNGYTSASLEMQTDGNLVIYRQAGHFPLKASNTATGTPDTYLALQDDGNLVLIRPGHPVRWATGTNNGQRAPAPTGARLCAAVGYGAGFRIDDARATLRTAVQVALAESACNPTARSTTNDYGLWQINRTYHPQYSVSQLYDPQTNANAAWSISRSGTDWTPWTTYRNGAYTRQLNTANAAITQL